MMGVVASATSCSAVALLTACAHTAASNAVWCDPDLAPRAHTGHSSGCIPSYKATLQWLWVHALSISKAQDGGGAGASHEGCSQSGTLACDAQEAASHPFFLPVLLKLRGEILLTLVLQPFGLSGRRPGLRMPLPVMCHVQERHSQRGDMLVMDMLRKITGPLSDMQQCICMSAGRHRFLCDMKPALLLLFGAEQCLWCESLVLYTALRLESLLRQGRNRS